MEHEIKEIRVAISEFLCEDAKSSLDYIDKPFQQLTRLLAGRFPDNNKSRMEKTDESSQKSSSKNSQEVWQSGLNRILLGIITVLCLAILYFVVNINGKNKFSNIDHQEQADNTILHESAEDLGGAELTNESRTHDESDAESEESVSESYDKWDDCFLDIQNGGDYLKEGTQYILLFTKGIGGVKANVPDGEWIVEIESGHPINQGNSFTIPANTPNGTRVQIKYIVNDKPVKVRTPTVVK